MRHCFQVVPKPDDQDQGKVQVEIMLRERPVKTAETELEWSMAPGRAVQVETRVYKHGIRRPVPWVSDSMPVCDTL